VKLKLLKRNEWSGKFLAALIFENTKTPLGLSKKEGQKFVSVAGEENFRSQYKKTILLRSGKGKQRLLFAGLGKKKDFETDRVRVAVAKLIKRAEEMKISELGFLMPEPTSIPCSIDSFIAASVEGAILASYHYIEYRTKKPDDPVSPRLLGLLFDSNQVISRSLRKSAVEARTIAEAVCYTRDLVNEPPSRKTPEMMAKLATRLVKRGRITAEVLHKKQLARMGMNGILRVGAGSQEPPCLVHLIYKPKGKSKKTVCVVGKGITFDSGGLSLKPSKSMDTMKFDMAGAATVFGLFKLLAGINVPVTVHGLAPMAENMPGGSAQKPGDVIRAYNGKTIEVLNTDAEGRLVLADALAYGSTLKPNLIIDMATLTGACLVALGDEYSGMMGTDQKTIDRLIALGKEQGEFFWQLPLADRYRAHIKSKIADIKNMGKERLAGTIAAALFLQEFVDKKVPWVHIDIAGPAFTQKDWDYAPAGATGVPLRTLAAFIRSL